MPLPPNHIVSLLVAVGIGLLIGVERERRKGEGAAREAAGLRTFAIAGLLGAVAVLAGGVPLLSIATAGIIILAVLSHQKSRSDDPGITTEVALILTTALAGLAVAEPMLAAGSGVAVAVLLAARNPMHHFAKRVLTDSELKSALTLAAATLVIWPVLPDRYLGPYEALNPSKLWTVVILAMMIGSAGYVAVRVLGTRFGLPIAGLASGFVSSSATISAMGSKAADNERLLAPAAAGAVLSNTATIIQAALLISVVSAPTLVTLALPLSLGASLAIAYGLLVTLQASSTVDIEVSGQPGQPFDTTSALILACVVAISLVAAATARAWFGERGLLLAAAAAGIADAHSAALSVSSLVAAGKVSAHDARIPIIVGLTTNSVVKCVLAITQGGSAFAWRVVPGIVLMTLGLWVGLFVVGLLPHAPR